MIQGTSICIPKIIVILFSSSVNHISINISEDILYEYYSLLKGIDPCTTLCKIK